ncbi:flagellar hook-associated protein FlgK [Sphingomonas qilianensis]|uniref:Flagellar hook-associated protein 1 n=1 Tax=Sphingomonas qilianensis TaxID=1736690 RepID=A0ABU9XQP4_9SPHN
MSLNEILHTATSGLAASQAGMRSVSNNIANVGVSGYARERTATSTAVTAGRVTGVLIGEPARVADSFLENAVFRRGGDMGRSEAVSSYLDRLQALLGAPGAASGIAGRIDAIAASAARMTGALGSPETIAQFTGNVADSLASFRQLDSDVSNLRGDVETELGFTVDRINVLLSQIHDLNDQIAQTGGQSAAGAENRRVAAVDELSTLMKVNVRQQADGRMTIDTASGQVLLDRRLRVLSYPAGPGVSQPTYPAIDIRFAGAVGSTGAATGDRIDSSAVGGKLGGLIDMRDRTLPAFTEQLGVLFTGLAQTLNAAANAGTTVPAPAELSGRASGLVGSDRLGFTGGAVFAVLGADGTVLAKTTVDFDALGAGATVDDAVAAINAGLVPQASAQLVDGVLSIRATNAGTGVAVAQSTTAPSARAGSGFAQFFGLNDLVRSGSSALVPSGFTAADVHGFAAGQTAQLAVRDASGRVLASYTLTGTGGPSFGDLLSDLNASPLSGFGSFAMDDKGRFAFTPAAGSTGATVSIPADSTDRLGTGRSFSALSGLTGGASGLRDAAAQAGILQDPKKLPLARLQLGAAVGEIAVGKGDIRGAADFVAGLAAAVDLGKDGKSTVASSASQLLGRAGAESAQASSAYKDAAARRDDATIRRDNFAGVNIDEELADMVVLQNSYSASARVITTASAMYDTLLAMLA